MLFTRLLSTLAAGPVFSFLTTMSTECTSPKLAVRLNHPSIPASFSPPVAVSIQLSVLNNAESPTTLLNWGTPLDSRANVLGVFEIRDSDSDEIVTLDTIKFARKLPPPKEDFIQIPPGGAVEAEVILPRVPLLEGHRYSIQAKGWWQAVWEKPLEDVPTDDLEKLTGAERGEFQSEVVPVHVTPE
ncbi:hypothetical protein BDW62DRAFT_188048 [Aspergillus aurantiobrunneus]